MQEIGGFIEFEHFAGSMLHENALALNCGRNCLAYLFKARGIKKLKVPCFICDSVLKVCSREGVKKSFYHIGEDFKPDKELLLDDDEWLYLVNFYGQLDNEELKGYIRKYKRVIIDQANAYFAEHIPGTDTIYTCRKWFGVADGAFLYTSSVLTEELPIDESYDRMRFLMGRYERSASEFYSEYTANNALFADEPIKRMSKLTANLLHAIDYTAAEKKRRDNFEYLQNKLGTVNNLVPEASLFMYPLMLNNGGEIRKLLQKKKIYIPTLWPSVFEITDPEDTEYKMARDILPLPIDQRYGIDEMEYMVKEIKNVLSEGIGT